MDDSQWIQKVHSVKVCSRDRILCQSQSISDVEHVTFVLLEPRSSTAFYLHDSLLYISSQ